MLTPCTDPCTTPDPGVVVEVHIPDWILDAEVSAKAIRLYAVLRLHAARSTDGLFPSRPVLAERLRVKELRTVTRLLRELDGIGALATIPLPRNYPPGPGTGVRARRRRADRNIQRAFRRIGERDGWSCRVCGEDRDLTVDHIISVANGGTDDDDNLQILCRPCNSSKGTR